MRVNNSILSLFNPRGSPNSHRGHHLSVYLSIQLGSSNKLASFGYRCFAMSFLRVTEPSFNDASRQNRLTCFSNSFIICFRRHPHLASKSNPLIPPFSRSCGQEKNGQRKGNCPVSYDVGTNSVYMNIHNLIELIY